MVMPTESTRTHKSRTLLPVARASEKAKAVVYLLYANTVVPDS